jgi:hypothetical protein
LTRSASFPLFLLHVFLLLLLVVVVRRRAVARRRWTLFRLDDERQGRGTCVLGRVH